MENWVLTRNGTVILRWTLRPLTAGEMSVTNVAEVAKRTDFMAGIGRKLGDSLNIPTVSKFSTVKDGRVLAV